MNPLPSGPPVIETPRLRLRALRLDDAAAQHAYAQNPEIADLGMWDHPLPTLEDNVGDLVETLASQARGETMEWGIELRGERCLIGRCGFVKFRPSHDNAELSYALARPYWRHGYMTEAVGALLDYGFVHLDLQRIEAICLVDNAASFRLLAKAGFALEGVARAGYSQHGNYKDLRRYAILRDEFRPAPAG